MHSGIRMRAAAFSMDFSMGNVYLLLWNSSKKKNPHDSSISPDEFRNLKGLNELPTLVIIDKVYIC